MKTYKVYYHTHEIIFEADSSSNIGDATYFYKNGSFIASMPNSCPYTVIGIKPNDNEK